MRGIGQESCELRVVSCESEPDTGCNVREDLVTASPNSELSTLNSQLSLKPRLESRREAAPGSRISVHLLVPAVGEVLDTRIGGDGAERVTGEEIEAQEGRALHALFGQRVAVRTVPDEGRPRVERQAAERLPGRAEEGAVARPADEREAGAAVPSVEIRVPRIHRESARQVLPQRDLDATRARSSDVEVRGASEVVNDQVPEVVPEERRLEPAPGQIPLDAELV